MGARRVRGSRRFTWNSFPDTLCVALSCDKKRKPSCEDSRSGSCRFRGRYRGRYREKRQRVVMLTAMVLIPSLTGVGVEASAISIFAIAMTIRGS